MKALSIKQPYADWILTGKKTIELRTWKTKYRGRVRICSSGIPFNLGLPAGVTICDVELVDVTEYKPEHAKDAHSTWQPELYAWHFKFIKSVKQKKIKGKLGIYDLD